MKQRDLIKKLESIGFQFERHGGNHDIYRRNHEIEQIPRHKEINEKYEGNYQRQNHLMMFFLLVQ